VTAFDHRQGPRPTGDQRLITPAAASVEHPRDRTPGALTLGGDEPQGERERTARIHIVQRGDTAWELAERYLGDGRKVPELARANPHIRDLGQLEVGQRITIPDGRERPAAAPTNRPGTYTIQKGDTLSEIAERLLGRSGRYEQILVLNPGLNPKALEPGQVIKVPAQTGVVTPVAPAVQHTQLTLSDRGIGLIKEAESFRSRSYLCPSGTWTIGYGTTEGVTRGMQVSETEAIRLLRRDVRAAESTVRELVKVPLNPNQFDALVVFVHNVGEPQFKSSTLLRHLNAGRFDAAAREFSRWNKADGEVLDGLTTRRAAEQKLFREPVTPAR